MQTNACSYGKVGQFLAKKIRDIPSMELVFVWNRSSAAFDGADAWLRSRVLDNLDDFESRCVYRMRRLRFLECHLCLLFYFGA
jgi:hypothetical protein